MNGTSGAGTGAALARTFEQIPARPCSRWRELVETLSRATDGHTEEVPLRASDLAPEPRRRICKQIISLGRKYGIRIHYRPYPNGIIVQRVGKIEAKMTEETPDERSTDRP